MLDLTSESQGTWPEERTLFISSRWWPGVYFRLCMGWGGRARLDTGGRGAASGGALAAGAGEGLHRPGYLCTATADVSHTGRLEWDSQDQGTDVLLLLNFE